MREIRIHVDQPLHPGAECVLPAQAGEHLQRVLRLGPGAALVLFNGDGLNYRATLTRADRREVRARVESAAPATTESPLRLMLAQGIARGDKMDFIVQKATELGVAAIVPLLTERSEVRLDPARAGKRLEHWRAVAAGAAEQCGRATLPQVLPAQALDAWLAGLATGSDVARLALLPGGDVRCRELAFGTAGGLLVVGPEGGLGKRDTAALHAAGFLSLALGPRILRTETAGLAALAALQALHGDV